MARRQISIHVKLITVSTLLLVVVIGLFGVINSVQSRRIIDDFSKMVRMKVKRSLRQSGTAQLRLLAETTRIALLQSDYSTLQTTVGDVGRQDLVTAVAVVNARGTVLAHTDKRLAGKPAAGYLRDQLKGPGAKVTPELDVSGKKSIAFSMPVTEQGRRLCNVFLAYSLEPLEKELVNTALTKSREMTANLRNTLVVGLMAVLLGVLLTIIQSISLSRPIRALAQQADQMANGDLEARVEIKSHDEIGLLGQRFNYMAEQMVALLRETLTKATMEKELEIASAVQSTLVPDASVAELEGMKLSGFFRPATRCGGDWWSYYPLAENRSLVLVGDVTGRGVGAAMITATAQGAVTTVVEATRGHVELNGLLRAMNSAIHSAAKGKFAMTCFASLYDPKTNSLCFANAGHNFPFFFDAEAEELHALVIRGNRLGDGEDGDYETGEVTVKSGDALVWYTDGIVECENASGEVYGERRFRAEIRRHAGESPDAALERVVNRASEFCGDAVQKDDITLVVGKFV